MTSVFSLSVLIASPLRQIANSSLPQSFYFTSTFILIRTTRRTMMKYVLLLLPVLMLLSTGCQDKNAVNTAAATGVVMLDGEPFEGAIVSFVPTTEGLRDSAAVSGQDGKFVLMTPGATKNGAMIGEYDVFVEKRIAVDDAGNPLKEEPVDPNAPMGSLPPPKMPKFRSLVPQKYRDKTKPLFHVQVEKGGKNHFVLELDSK
jgi:hypothetical protein